MLVGLSLAPRAAAARAEDNGYVDAHVYVWTPDTDAYPLDANFSKQAMQPPSFTPEELFQHCESSGVDRIVLIQMSFYQYDNRYMLDMVKAHPGRFSAVGIVDYHRADLVSHLATLQQAGVRGLRIHSRGGNSATWNSDPAMAKLWRTCQRMGIAICPLINTEDIPLVDRLCQQHPDTTVVVDHFGRVGISGTIDEDDLNNLCRLARFPNVNVKTSAFYALGEKRPPYRDLLPMIARVRDAFGPQRLMWASDCPYQVQGRHTYEASIALIRDAGESLFSAGDKEWLLRKTAERIFF